MQHKNDFALSTGCKVKMKKDLNDIFESFTANKLTINPSKLNVLVIPPKLSQPLPNVDLSINNLPLPFCLSAKYLDVTLDTQLNFDKNISSIENKISRAVGIISKLRHYLPTRAILQLYYSLIHMHLYKDW